MRELPHCGRLSGDDPGGRSVALLVEGDKVELGPDAAEKVAPPGMVQSSMVVRLLLLTSNSLVLKGVS